MLARFVTNRNLHGGGWGKVYLVTRSYRGT